MPEGLLLHRDMAHIPVRFQADAAPMARVAGRGNCPNLEPVEAVQSFVSVLAVGDWQFGPVLP